MADGTVLIEGLGLGCGGRAGTCGLGASGINGVVLGIHGDWRFVELKCRYDVVVDCSAWCLVCFEAYFLLR